MYQPQQDDYYPANQNHYPQNNSNQNSFAEPGQYNQHPQEINNPHTQGHGGKPAGHGDHGGEYNPLQIPPNYEEAKKHAASRLTGPVIKKSELRSGERLEFCKCCGYQVQRKQLSAFKDNFESLQFLGSGFPCFYNWIIYSIVILLTLFAISGAYNIYTNLQGTFCNHDDLLDNPHQGVKIDIESEMKLCHRNFAHIFSLVNKLDENGRQYYPLLNKLNFITALTVMVIMMLFRKSQRTLDRDIDDEIISPSDYTIIVKNIPKGMQTDYERELRHIFTYNAVQNKKGEPIELNVTKINLVYNIDYVIELEEKLAEEVAEKQSFLQANKGFRPQDPVFQDMEGEIEHIEGRIHHLEHNIPHDQQKYFTGIAFISFQTEQEKDMVIEQNPYTFAEKFYAFTNPNGKVAHANKEELTWDGRKLFIDEAPEPDDIDWEFIHKSTMQKIKARTKAWIVFCVFIAICFALIWSLSDFQNQMIEKTYAQAEQGNVNQTYFFLVKSYSFLISMGIVLFNKFCLGKVTHIIVDKEFYSTKTKLNIAFATKLTLALFITSALITYLAEILTDDNYYGPGGFIYTETWVFIWNCILPPLVWAIDPWTFLKNRKRNKELKKKKDQSFLTQQEANSLMEEVEYTQGKRYADMMKTMWFTFFYGSCIPLGIIFSCLSLIAYYWADKYNVVHRRTIKESLSSEVSIEMIENLEISLLFFAIGNVTFANQLFNSVDTFAYIQLGIAVIYALLPMQEINEWIWPLERKPSEHRYQDVELNFMTDYDRQNPITKKDALKRHQTLVHSNQQYKYSSDNNYKNPYH